MKSWSALLFIVLAASAAAHSTMTQPQSTSSLYCSFEEDEGFCRGPCDLRMADEAPHGRPGRPSATYRRGEKIRVKYVRNNHRSGGFVRLALVKPEDVMDKEAHERGAFHYSCWGAKVALATDDDQEEDEFGFNISGNDGEEHDLPVAYYYVDVKIPRVVPDGVYVLGQVWYGGTAGPVTSNDVLKPFKYGMSSDYWSCAYIRVRGGKSVKASFRPKFRNDMKQFSAKGCRAINDEPDVCPGVPCDTEVAKYRKPGPFVGGSKPDRITTAHFE